MQRWRAMHADCVMAEPGACAGSYFNRGKILGMLGREAAAEEAYHEAVRASEGVSPGSFSKSLAALREYGAAEVASLEDALLYLRLSAGEGGGGLCMLLLETSC